MTIANMIRQLKVVEIIMICILAKSLYGKTLNKIKDERVKRGYSHYGGNDFGSSVHVSSGVLQYSSGDEHSISSDSNINEGHSSSLDVPVISSDHFGGLDAAASNVDAWSGSGLSSGYDVWLEPLDESHATSALDSSAVHASSMTSIHPTGDHVVNTVFSDDSPQSAHIEWPSSQLHTKISSSSVGNSAADIGSGLHGHAVLAVSDHIDFNNVADVNTNHYAKSYGK